MTAITGGFGPQAEATDITQHIAFIQRILDAGATPETDQRLQGLVKQLQREVAVDCPGKRFKALRQTVTVLAPDEDAIRERVNETRARKQREEESRALAVSRMAFIE